MDYVEVEVAGRRAHWDGATFGGDPEVAQLATEAAEARLIVSLFDVEVTASANDPVGAAAAMLAFAGGSGRVLQGPTETFAEVFGRVDE